MERNEREEKQPKISFHFSTDKLFSLFLLVSFLFRWMTMHPNRKSLGWNKQPALGYTFSPLPFGQLHYHAGKECQQFLNSIWHRLHSPNRTEENCAIWNASAASSHHNSPEFPVCINGTWIYFLTICLCLPYYAAAIGASSQLNINIRRGENGGVQYGVALDDVQRVHLSIYQMAGGNKKV